jgi:predicted DNA-binding transcriptional regulator YafY
VAKKNTKKAPAEKASRAPNDEMFERVQIIRDLASGNGYPTRRELAGKFGISERALANIIAAMKSRMGIDIRSELGPEGRHGYKVHDANFLRTKMSRPEAIASVLLTEAVLGTPLIGDRKAAQSSNAKLEGAIDPDVRRQLDRLKQRFAVRLLQEAKKPGEGFFSRVLDGIAENRVLQVSYEKPAEAAKRRREDAGTPSAAARAQRIESLEIEPWGIFFAKRSWYLVARKRSTGDLRQYKLARFRRMDLTDRTFEVDKGWTIERYAADMWESMKDGAGRRHTVRIEIAEPMAEVVSETQWHPSQVIERRRDGSMVLTATISGLDEVRSWVLGMGAGARVLEPKELRDQVDAEIRKMAARLDA